jgi:hydrogenase expression/formation protein HypD
MRYIDEFRDRDKATALVREIEVLARVIGSDRQRPIQIMEVCGGHTHSIFRYGIEGMLPEQIELVHGPGCPVCVLPMGRIDDCIDIASQPGVIVTTFGDAMRVPGSRGSLLQAKAEGADIRMVYSPMDALALARANPDREVVFFGLGFETTMPSTALTVLDAERDGIGNFSVFCNHITIVPTIKAILDSPDLQIDGFLGPGHVSMVIGTAPYEFIAGHYRFEWRGLGAIDYSGVRFRDEFARFDAERKFTVPGVRIADPLSCQCGEVLKGVLKPHQCKVFGAACTPETPLGALMVSSEGACAAYYRYVGKERVA